MTQGIPDDGLDAFIESINSPDQKTSKKGHAASRQIPIDDVLKGNLFYGKPLSDVLELALTQVGSAGYLATLPELIAAKVKAGNDHFLWEHQFMTAHTELNFGADKKGRFYDAYKPVFVIVNGGGILTPARIKQAYDDGLDGDCAKYTNEEFDDLLDGILPDGSTIKLYHFDEEIKRGVSHLPHRFGVVMPYSVAQDTESGYFKKDEFLANPLIIACNAGTQNLEDYFDLTRRDTNDSLSCNHDFKTLNPNIARGFVLHLYRKYKALECHSNLKHAGRYVGVVPSEHEHEEGGKQ